MLKVRVFLTMRRFREGLGKEREMIDGMSRRWHGGGTDAYGARAADKIES